MVREKLNEIDEMLARMNKELPQQVGSFAVFMRRVLKDGSLDLKTKEMIALALGMSSGCEWCISLHVKKALEAGATKEQILEAGAVAVLMAGGPALMNYIPLLKALDELS